MANSSRDRPDPITVLVIEDAGGGMGLKIPEFGVEIYGPDLPELIEQAEGDLWRELEASGRAVPETSTLAIRRVTNAEFGPTCFEIRAEEVGRMGDE